MSSEYLAPSTMAFSGAASYTCLSRSNKLEASHFLNSANGLHEGLQVPDVLSDQDTNHISRPTMNRILSRVIAELSRITHDEDEPASTLAVEGIKALLSKAIPLVRKSNSLPDPRLLVFQGGIRVTWIRPKKNIRLVWPGRYDQSPYVYQERVYDAQSFSQEVFSPVDVTALVRSLNWLNV